MFFRKNWDKRIKEAEQTGEFSFEDKNRATDWKRCSMSERFILKSRDELPVQERFGKIGVNLGYDFNRAVQLDCVKLAKEIHLKIKAL